MNVKNLRLERGVTQLDLAFGAKISRFRLFMIEKGYQKPTAEEIQKIKKYLNRTIENENGGKNEIKK